MNRSIKTVGSFFLYFMALVCVINARAQTRAAIFPENRNNIFFNNSMDLDFVLLSENILFQWDKNTYFKVIKNIGPLTILIRNTDLPLSQENEIIMIGEATNEKLSDSPIKLSVLTPGIFDFILRKEFYAQRGIDTSIRVLFAGKEAPDTSGSHSPAFRVCQIKHSDPADSVRLKIIKLPGNPIPVDRISIVFKPIVHELLGPEEFLLAGYFMYHFFQSQIVKHSDQFKIQYNPVSILTRDEIPEYTPLISLHTGSANAGKLLAEWDQISRALLRYNQIDHLNEIRAEIENRLLFEVVTPDQELNFVARLALLHGYLKPLTTFKSDLQKLDLKRFVEKLRSIFSGKLYHIYWGTQAERDEKALKKIDSILKYENIDHTSLK